MKAVKIIMGILVALVLLIALGLFLLFKNLDSIVHKAIETLGTEILQTEVSLDETALTLTEGRVVLNGLSIQNPTPYEAPTFLTLDTIALQIDPSSLQSDVIYIDEFTIDGTAVTLEQRGIKDTNLQTLLNNIQAYTGGGQTEPETESTGAQKRFAIKTLQFVNTDLTLMSPHFDTKSYSIAGIRRHDIGSRSQGLTPKELALAIVQPLLDEAKVKLKDELKTKGTDQLKAKLEDSLSDKDKDKLEDLKGLLSR